ncbi:cytochrome P450 [Mesobaculum littorinae]|uniref:Cytochrome P450 n=1 Tax=Mesobaculum littorinae TaxID=2486419 RepID=A0A438AG00_9RHOB|nr:cytochrome P450 [Mesobaculum littorinae]RVV97535.1 cytochrome P450 [Mesobaculum littorinae]
MSDVTDRPSLDLDPFSRETMADPIPVDRAIREAGDMVWLPRYKLWATGRDAVIREIFDDWERFSSSFGTGLTNVVRDEPWRKPSVILEADPPGHTAHRKVLQRVLSPKVMRQLREDFFAQAEEMVAGLVAQRRFDAAHDLAFAFPFKVLPDSVGMRKDGREHLMPYATLNFNAMGPRNDLYEAARKVVEEMGTFDYVVRQMARDNLEPGGFGEEIFKAADAGEITADSAGMLVRTFISAGIDTTAYGIGLTIRALLQHTEQWEMLAADPSLANAAFEETLRWTPSSPIIGRTTASAFDFHGVRLGKEEKVLTFLAAANRDPDKWEDPDRFDITRRAAGHLAFGWGIHACVGQMVARLEAAAVLTALARQVSAIRLTGEPVQIFNNWLRGYESIPVEVTPK